MTEKSANAFRTISEAAEELDLPAHVLRFWETRFPQIKPMKRGGGRRYYRPDDVELLKGIRYLLYVRGFTIRGVQRILKESGHRAVMAIGAGDLSGLDRLQAGRAQRTDPESVADDAEDIEADGEDQPVPEQRRGGLSNLLRRDRDAHGSSAGAGLSRDGVDRLNGVILELLELKRLLDQVR
ncbi:MerR family transcriptional regulator [Aureimonas flava]|uniref:MerR family transcriptional regulator n=1 Tax=Aureimonas flava TaxID=2320271 RepID=A0A3A1WRB0_9HYPH|nr:MerR family transcriptional regulator [Aureimonas flava]RIY03576.1 MerR family transcriptional regulator [Aureimonas flava]